MVVGPETALVTVEIFLEDLFLFHSLQPDAADFLSQGELNRGAELHRQFVSERFMIRDKNGRPLPPVELPAVTAEIPPNGVPLAELMSHTMTFDLRYEFASPPPFLTFAQHFSGPDAILPAEMQLQVQQRSGGPLFNGALVSGEPQTLRLDWSGPAPPAEATDEERQQWLQQQSEATLGITSYSSVYSFLYLEDFEVRHEILIPLLTLEEHIPLPRREDAFLTVAEQDQVRPAIEEFFVTGNPLQINGVSGTPDVQRCDFYGVSFTDFAQPTERRDVAMASARVGVILSWPLREPLQSVKLVWNRFSKSVWAVRMTVFHGSDTERVTLARVGSRNSFTRTLPQGTPRPAPEGIPADPATGPQRHLPLRPLLLFLPLLALILILRRRSWSRTVRILTVSGTVILAVIAAVLTPATVPVMFSRAPGVPEAQGRKICEQLLPQLYEAFRYRREQDIYDALAVTVDGALLQDIYLQLLDGLKMQSQGGAVARIRQVIPVSTHRVHPADVPGTPCAFTCQCRWNVSGEVEHWGHVHHRQNQFAGRFTLAVIDGGWKLVGLDVTDDRQLSASTTLRTVSSKNGF